jgi:hypothetical protein
MIAIGINKSKEEQNIRITKGINSLFNKPYDPIKRIQYADMLGSLKKCSFQLDIKNGYTCMEEKALGYVSMFQFVPIKCLNEPFCKK